MEEQIQEENHLTSDKDEVKKGEIYKSGLMIIVAVAMLGIGIFTLRNFYNNYLSDSSSDSQKVSTEVTDSNSDSNTGNKTYDIITGPQDLLNDTNYNLAKQDVDSVSSALRLYIQRDLGGSIKGLKDSCLSGDNFETIDINDGIDPDEGLSISSFDNCLSEYLGEFPTDSADIVFRWGVDNAVNPSVVFVGLTQTSSDPDAKYPDYYSVYP
ncbi:hypothetical protein KC660_03665 [Candidatus Dojkabacteria bacterium]|uniref:Uncharacterized protein n=1 Tax=Candidatus Dojkabacteria bacterium TaxID=2099670 RepID=A0A955L3V5_9BACT|nr:hypothetical protein [Candidatus Dojkabacteria bacterium]